MKYFALFALCLMAVGLAVGQESFPRAEIFGGYSYLNIDTNGLSSRQSANGWEASASGNFNKWFAAEADVSGHYKKIGAVSVSDYAYLAGPRINVRPIFIHALVGGDHLTGSALGSQDGLAGAFGGGVQFKVAPHLSIRSSGDYVFSRHNILGGSSVTQNNFRAGVGLVYSFGGVSRVSEPKAMGVKVARPEVARSRSGSGMPIPALGLRANPRESGGAQIEEIVSGSTSEQAGLRIGDVINFVDGKAVRTPMELAAELSNQPPGAKVRLGYLVHGYWQAETVIILPSKP